MWFKVDDQLHDHRKARQARKAAMGVWVLAGSWSAANGTAGFIPDNVLPRWGNRVDAKSLVAAGLWHETERDGECGWQFHDWSEFQPSPAVVEAMKAKQAEAGRRGNHRRWHTGKGISDPNCEYCYRVPDQEPDWVPDRDEVGEPIGSASGQHRPVPEPDPEPTTSDEVVGGGKRRTAKRSHQLPDDWQPNEKARNYAREHGVPVTEVDQFRDHHTARGSTMKDWDAAFMTWLRNSVKFSGGRLAQAKPAKVYPDARTLETPPDDLTDEEYAQWHRERVAR